MRKRPLATKMATCLIGFGAGDLVAQTLQFAKAPQLPEMPKRKLLAEMDYGRIARMALFGALVAAPQMHVFFTWLDKVCLNSWVEIWQNIPTYEYLILVSTCDTSFARLHTC
jgi:hypothetical protein